MESALYLFWAMSFREQLRFWLQYSKLFRSPGSCHLAQDEENHRLSCAVTG